MNAGPAVVTIGIDVAADRLACAIVGWRGAGAQVIIADEVDHYPTSAYELAAPAHATSVAPDMRPVINRAMRRARGNARARPC